MVKSVQELAKGQFTGPTGRANQKRLWQELAFNLNSQGFGQKEVQKWQKTWTDFKYTLKKKAAAIKKDQTATGGGPSQVPPLNDYEERALQILGKPFFEGVGVEELGFLNEKNKRKECTQNETEEPADEMDLSVEFGLTASSSTPRVLEHTYSKIPVKKRIKTTELQLCMETVDVLKDIRNTPSTGFSRMNTHLQDINETLKTLEKYHP